jgi:hypothetical protein
MLFCRPPIFQHLQTGQLRAQLIADSHQAEIGLRHRSHTIRRRMVFAVTAEIEGGDKYLNDV